MHAAKRREKERLNAAETAQKKFRILACPSVQVFWEEPTCKWNEILRPGAAYY